MSERTSSRRSGRRRRYAPRNGTMRGSGEAPALTASRSDHAPAHTRTWPASSVPSACTIRTARPFAAMSWTSRPSSTRPPASSSSRRSAAATSVKSTIPVAGECSAAMPAAAGARAGVSPPRRGGGAGGLGLDRGVLVAAEAAQAGDAVRLPAALELVQAGQLGLVERDDQLAAALSDDLVLLAEQVQVARAADAQLRLQRSRDVVDARVDDAGVVAGLVAGDLRLLVDHRDRLARVPVRELARGGEADDPGSDDGDVRPHGQAMGASALSAGA